jgi:RHS repeat-associated protein
MVKVPRLAQSTGGTTTQIGYRATVPYTLQYNGKELQLLANTTLIDYGARQYNPTLARWTAQDPLSEKYYGISPYAYCIGNPILLVDKEGKHPLLWIAASLLIDYGLQVYNNYDLGKSGSDAWWGDINMVSLAASAIPITGYAQMTKMMGINLLDAIVKYTPNDGLTIETSAKKILKTAAIHTLGATAGKQVTKASSKTSVQKVSKEVKEANKAVRKAKRNVEKHPNSAKKVEQQKSAEINAQNARKKEVVVKTLNSTIGQAPKATEEASKTAAKAYTYKNDKED